MAVSVPRIDFTPLGQLGDIYRQNKVQGAREGVLSGFSGDMTTLGSLGQRLMQAGDFEGGMTLTKMAQAHEQQTLDRAWKMAQAGETASYRDQMLDLQRDRIEADRQPKTPAGFERTPGGGMRYIPGGPADPAYKKAAPPARAMSSASQKAILEADDAVRAGEATVGMLDRAMELNKSAFYGPAAGTLGYATSLFGNDRGEATEELNNLVTAQALEQLRATFGSMPTEGERKILLDIQGSVSQAPEVREKIYARAKNAVRMRTEYNRRQAQGLRSGTYFAPDGQPQSSLLPEPHSIDGALQEAREAIQQGADQSAVIQRLLEAGIDPSAL